MSATIRVDGVSKRYRSTRVLDGLDLVIEPGVTGLLGPNGAGKTTLLRILATVMAPDSGRLELLGRDPGRESDRTEIRRRLGYVPQETGIHDDFTAFEFVDYLAILKELDDRTARHDEVRRVLEVVGLSDVRHKKLRRLSGGMRRRVVIAQALLDRPELLVLDEPTVGLDPEQRLRFREMLSSVGPGATVVLSTHQTTDISALCQRVVVLGAGQVHFDGTPAELTSLAAGRVWMSDDRDPGSQRRLDDRRGSGPQRGHGPTGRRAGRAEHRGRLPPARRHDRRGGGAGRMTITVAFLIVVGVILVGGALYRRWDESHHLRFTDEAGTSRAVRALARFESRKVLTHPTWLITLVLLTTLTTTLILMETSGSIPHDAPVTWFAVIGIPVSALALVVSLHRIGTRSRRHRTDELEAATPTAPRARTMALLIACLTPLPVMVAALAVGVITSQLAYSLMPPPGPVARGARRRVPARRRRWRGRRRVPVPVAALRGRSAAGHRGDRLAEQRRRPPPPTVPLAPRRGREPTTAGMFDVRPVGWSAMFIVGLIVLGACLALWRHPARPSLIGATAAAVLVIVATGWTMTRTPSATEIADRVDLLEHPTDHQHCESRGAVDYCVYPGAETWIDTWDPGDPRRARPGPGRASTRRAGGGATHDRRHLAVPRGRRRRSGPCSAWPADGRLHPPLWLEDERTPDMTVAWQTAAIAVGLPPATDWQHPTGCLAGGQARLVLAHLLAGRATATTAEALHRKADHVRDEGRWDQPVPMDLQYDYGEQDAPPDGDEPVRSRGTGRSRRTNPT